MTGISYEHSKHPSLVAPIDEESYSQLIQALSPPKPLSCISQAQSNTPAALTLPVKTKLSAAAEARSASYGKSGSRASVSIPKDVSYSGSREASGSSTKSNPMPADVAVERGTAGKVHPSPSGPVKGRKEGLSQENKENEAETPLKESDKASPKLIASPVEGKRRQSLGSSREDCLNINRKEPAVLVSPTQDLPRVEDVVNHADFDCFLDSQPTLVGATADADETE
jgi:hypothetical protein